AVLLLLLLLLLILVLVLLILVLVLLILVLVLVLVPGVVPMEQDSGVPYVSLSDSEQRFYAGLHSLCQTDAGSGTLSAGKVAELLKASHLPPESLHQKTCPCLDSLACRATRTLATVRGSSKTLATVRGPRVSGPSRTLATVRGPRVSGPSRTLATVRGSSKTLATVRGPRVSGPSRTLD
ncbi:hypothetical protein CRUP_006838, partial [Coryphaenoides rupestris]